MLKRSRSSWYFDFSADKEIDKSAFNWYGKVHSSQSQLNTGRSKHERKAFETTEDSKKLIVVKPKLLEKKPPKKHRIIIRNLSFMVDEKELIAVLSKFGTVVDVTIPKTADGQSKGFAFAQFNNFSSSSRAIRSLNFKKLHGRPVAIDYAIPKSKYEHIMSSKNVAQVKQDPCVKREGKSKSARTLLENDEPQISEIKNPLNNDLKSMNELRNRRSPYKGVSQFLEEFDFKSDSDGEEHESLHKAFDELSDNEGNSGTKNKSLGNSVNNSVQQTSRCSKQMLTLGGRSSKQPLLSSDAKDGKTVFVRNVSFETTEQELKEKMSEFGPLKYCLLCIDRETELPKGTAFVKFENKCDAEKLIEKSSDTSEGVFLDGRKLYCVLALSHEELKTNSSKKNKQKQDKRNLCLLKESAIMADSEEAKTLSRADFAKRVKLEAVKKRKLKNLNYFVSKTRLCIHNIPPNYTEQQLRKLFKCAAGNSAVITEARIIKDMRKVNAQGEPKSKGFGFVTFTRHEDALVALKKLNNNPTVFHAQNKPIVEFSVENHLALLTKQRRHEKNKLRHKKNRNEKNCMLTSQTEQLKH